MNALAARRRHPAAIALLLLLGLVVTGAAYSVARARSPRRPPRARADAVADGQEALPRQLRHLPRPQRPGHARPARRLVGVGAASVDFQVGTGRMPLAGPGVQAQRQDKVKFTDEQIAALAAYVASLAPGPAIPDADSTPRATAATSPRAASCSGSTARCATTSPAPAAP